MRWPGITRFSLVCLRFDDYHQSIDHGTWVEVLSEYDDRGFVGVIGVVPKYHGEALAADVVPFLKRLRENGWEVAQHGFEHRDVGAGRGGPLYDDRSEFAGLSYDEQHRRIAEGRDLLRSHGLDPTTFIPPWHEYDRTTLRALGELGFDCLNEGRLPLPRTVSGVTLVPTHVPAVTPSMLAVGVVTEVRHPHLDDDPLVSADLLAGHRDRVRTPGAVARWWRRRGFLGSGAE